MTSDDRELVQVLIELGLKRPTALTLIFLGRGGKASSAQIQGGTGLKQPEVSVAMKDLKARGWIKLMKEKSQGRGRSTQYATLAVKGNQIISELKTDNQAIIAEIHAKLDELQSLKD